MLWLNRESGQKEHKPPVQEGYIAFLFSFSLVVYHQIVTLDSLNLFLISMITNRCLWVSIDLCTKPPSGHGVEECVCVWRWRGWRYAILGFQGTLEEVTIENRNGWITICDEQKKMEWYYPTQDSSKGFFKGFFFSNPCFTNEFRF